MLEQVNFESLYINAIQWLNSRVLDQDVPAQGIFIAVSFIMAAIIYRFSRDTIIAAIDRLRVPLRFKRALTNMRRLIFSFAMLVILFVITQVAGSEAIGLKTGFADGIMKVLSAWIAIRISLQFIGNTAIRNFFAGLTLIIAALSIFGVLEQTTTTLDAIGFSIGDFRLSALAIIKSVISICVLLYIALFTSSFAERRVRGVKGLTRSSQVLISKVIRVSLIVTALFIGITSAGIDLSLFAVFGGAVGLGVGFGLQKGISNLFSGMLLLMDRSIEPGDVLELENGTFGWVRNMGARYTEIVSRDNKSFLIPNEDFITQKVVNWSHGDSLIRVEVTFGVHYNSDPHQVKELAEQAALLPERVVDQPEPKCWLIEFGDSSLNFSLRFWIKDAEEGITNIKGMVMMSLWDTFKEHNIQIPYPHREIFMHK